MAILLRIFRFLFWVLILSWSVAILRRFVRNMSAGMTRHNDADVDVTSGAVSRKLVRDPVCGVHIAEGLALSIRSGGENLYFCSAECRDKYFNKTQRIAANS